jgi:hypothetical protein
MSTLLQTPETAGERPLWLADETVLIGPVSKAKFPASREFSREFLEKVPQRPIFACEPSVTSDGYDQIPYASEQGILLTEQGICLGKQGICNPSSLRP